MINSNNRLAIAVSIYIATVIIVYLINLYVPVMVMASLTERFGETWAINLTNTINILIQVIIIYPVLKFVVMKKHSKENINKAAPAYELFTFDVREGILMMSRKEHGLSAYHLPNSVMQQASAAVRIRRFPQALDLICDYIKGQACVLLFDNMQ